MHTINNFSPVGPTFAGLTQPNNANMQQQMRALELQMAVLMALMQVGGSPNGNSAGLSGLTLVMNTALSAVSAPPPSLRPSFPSGASTTYSSCLPA